VELEDSLNDRQAKEIIMGNVDEESVDEEEAD